jgi:hypothetical protein
MIRTGSCKRSVPPPDIAVIVSLVISSKKKNQEFKLMAKLDQLENTLTSYIGIERNGVGVVGSRRVGSMFFTKD